MARQMTLSPSQLDALSCRLSWYWGYVCGYRPARKVIALELGTGIHEALDKYYGDKKDPVEVFIKWADKRIKEVDAQWDDDINDLMDMKQLGIVMLEGYLEEYDGRDDFTVIATEKTLKTPIFNPETGAKTPALLVARLDGIVRDHFSSKLFALEHKTFTTFMPSYLDKDHQFTAQVLLGKELAEQMELDEPIEGVIYNGLRKKEPTSRTKANFFERHTIYKTENHIRMFMMRAYWTYKEITRKDFHIFPQPNAVRCNQCNFKEPCAEYQSGGDYQFILDNTYEKSYRESSNYKLD